jgi:hypothetical protein
MESVVGLTEAVATGGDPLVEPAIENRRRPSGVRQELSLGRREGSQPPIMPRARLRRDQGRSFRHREGNGEPADAKSRQRPSLSLGGLLANKRNPKS